MLYNTLNFTGWSVAYYTGYQEVDLFTEIRGKPQPDFDSVFGSTTASQGIRSKSLMGGGILTPEAVGVHASMQPSFNSSQDVSGLTTDVESSLARAAENLCECVCVCVCVGVWVGGWVCGLHVLP